MNSQIIYGSYLGMSVSASIQRGQRLFNPLTCSVYCNWPSLLFHELCCEVSNKLAILWLHIFVT